MSLLIMSDTHGLTEEVSEIVRRHEWEKVLHCGDYCCDRSAKPFSDMLIVRGNNDFDAGVPNERIWDWQGLRIFMSHGHLQNVKFTLMNLKFRALESNASIVLFGHSHIPYCAEEDGIVYLNPGSVAETRRFPNNTYCMLDAGEEAEGKREIKVQYYDVYGAKVDKLGGRFWVRKMHG